MSESQFRRYAREAMALSIDATRHGEKDIFAGLAYTWALAALIEEKLECHKDRQQLPQIGGGATVIGGLSSGL